MTPSSKTSKRLVSTPVMENYGSSLSIADLKLDEENFKMPYMFGKRKLQPYTESDIRVEPTRYSDDASPTPHVDDDMLDKYVNRVLLSAVMKEVGGEEEFAKPEYDTNLSPSKRKPGQDKSQKQRKQDRKSKKSKKTEKKEEETIHEEIPQYAASMTPSTEPTITLPINGFRKMVNAEIESRAARIHGFYQCQWDQSQEDRMEAYRSLIIWRENFYRTEYMYIKTEADLNKLKASNEMLQKELDGIKDAKRKRRNAAKVRRNNKDRNNNDSTDN